MTSTTATTIIKLPFPRDQILMPGSFGPEDYTDFYTNPWEDLETQREQWEERETLKPWSSGRLPQVDLGDAEWHNYDPPRALLKAPGVTSHILLDIVASSVEIVKARNVEEDEQRREAEERRKREEAQRKQEAAKGQAPYLPVIIIEDAAASGALGDDQKTPTETVKQDPIPRPPLTSDLPIRAEKSRKFAIRRLFQRTHQRGESSASGAEREAALKDVDIGAAKEAKIQEAWTIFRNKFPGTVDQNAMVECVSCLDDFPVKAMFKAPCHSYCQDCFVRLINTAMDNEQQWPPKCCLNPIPYRDILRAMPSNMKRPFEKKIAESEVPVTDRVYCHAPDCGVWVRPDHINFSISQGRCERGHWTCTMCRGPVHGSDECPHDSNLNLTNVLAEEEGWKRCYNCHALVEHESACQHMTCRCGSQFCYVCGLVWGTCHCTMQQLRNLKTDVENRRLERMRREVSEAAELQDILAQIEEFEREEARKAELIRQEQERLEEERRQREIEERVRVESLRRRDVEIKFRELRKDLDALHDLQLVILETAVSAEEVDVEAGLKTRKEELAKKQEAEHEKIAAKISDRVSAREEIFNKDYSRRLAQEKKIEAEYRQQLTAYWTGRNEGDEQVERGMLPLRQRLDANYQAWKEWKAEQLESYRHTLDEECTIRRELMYSVKERLEDTCAEERLEFGRRQAAGQKWLEMLVLQRESMVGELEVQEMEGDADSLFSPDHEQDQGEEDLG